MYFATYSCAGTSRYSAQRWRGFDRSRRRRCVEGTRAVPLPDGVSFEQGACLGIPAITAHRCVHVAGPVEARTVLVQGGAGAVGVCAVQLARRAGALVIATVRSSTDEAVADRAGANHVIRPGADVSERVRALTPQGVHHIVEVAFGANIATDLELLAVAGSVATSKHRPFRSGRCSSKTSESISSVATTSRPRRRRRRCSRSMTRSSLAGPDSRSESAFPLEKVAGAHERVETPQRRGRVVVIPDRWL
jgi:NADPH2:quinone reductase